MPSAKELVTEHNQLCDIRDHLSEDEGLPFKLPEYETLKTWKGKKTELQARVAELRRMVLGVERGQRITIQLIAEEALLEIADEDEDGNRLGHPYPAILERVRALFPDAKTNCRTLAWYASKMRGAGMMVPFRPRAKNGEA